MTGDRTTREEIVDELRGHADLLDQRTMQPADAADETRRIARKVERGAPDWKLRADGSGAAHRAREFGAAGINFTERAMGNVLYLSTALMWMVSGVEGVSMAGFLLFAGGFLTLALGNRLKGWSS